MRCSVKCPITRCLSAVAELLVQYARFGIKVGLHVLSSCRDKNAAQFLLYTVYTKLSIMSVIFINYRTKHSYSEMEETWYKTLSVEERQRHDEGDYSTPQQHRHNSTRQHSYRKEDRAMRPIYGCPEKFLESSLRTRLLFQKFVMDFCSDRY